MSESQFARLAARAGLPGDASVRQVVNAVQAIPYGRPGSRTAEGVISEWKGTCSTKHALLAQLIRERRPDLRLGLVHRVYRVSRGSVIERHGADAASAVPDGGLTDVHRYLVMTRRPGSNDRRHIPRRPALGRTAVDAPSLRGRPGLSCGR